jgi:hypothetical protein
MFSRALAFADTNAIPSELRAGSFKPEKATIQNALELKRVGWTYIMPEPKSPQAAWGNHDGRTAWYVGYWVNDNDRSTSSGQPKKDEKGQFLGDGKGFKSWRRGGSPPRPTRIEWLCSKTGGVEPR